MPQTEREPNPGSPAAIDAGCTCPVIDNHYGEGENGRFWFRSDCPIHWLDWRERGERIRDYNREAAKAAAVRRRRNKETSTVCAVDQTMRERVARAMYDADNNDSPVGHRDPAWERTYPRLRQVYYRRADAAIREMREPTDSMLAAGVIHSVKRAEREAMTATEKRLVTRLLAASYPAMVDAAMEAEDGR